MTEFDPATGEVIEPAIGHNSQSVSAERLTSFIQRIERLTEERKTIGADIREVFAEAKCDGFDVRIMREVIRLRGMDAAELQEHRSIIDVYLRALGHNV